MKKSTLCLAVLFWLLTPADGENPPLTTTTIYVSKHFEVRAHDQPVKYVFNGDTRVARITGSLSSNARIQRLRLRSGWNLVSIAVTATNALQQLSAPAGGHIQSAYLWNPAGGDYSVITVGQTLDPGSVVWLQATTNAVVGILGAYSDPTTPTAPAGGTYRGGFGLETWRPQLSPGITIWKFDAAAGRWQVGFAEDLSPVNDLPPTLAPGDGIYVHTTAPAELAAPDPTLRIAYYHPDHLGSSSAITDVGGEVVEETAYYPFGAPRHEHHPRNFEAHYGFTEKERDRESRLHYFEARYLAGPVARFLSVDPKFAHPDQLSADDANIFVSRPEKANPYAYALNSPLNYSDPTGLDVVNKRARPVDRQSQSKGLPLVGPEAIPQPLETILSLKDGQGGTVQEITIQSFSRSQERRVGSRDVSISIVRRADRESVKLQQSQERGSHYKEAEIIVRTKGPKSMEFMRVKLSDVFVTGYVTGSFGDREPHETFTLNAAKGEIVAPPASDSPPSPWAEWGRSPAPNPP